MQVSRLGLLALLIAAASASGCRTAGVSDLARPDPPLAPKSASAIEILAAHNRNAERIKIIDARPALTITVYDERNQKSEYSVDGTLTMERPRNFKLDISEMGTKMADIGSNDAEFWFWVKDKTQRAIYYCNHEEAGTSPLAATFQPDWIIEAMGLRVIPEAEAAKIKVTEKPGEPGKLVLTHRPHQSGDASYTRVTIIDKATHLILEHQIRTGDQKTMLARAVVPEGYMEVSVPSEPGGSPVLLPKRLSLYWIQERLDLDVTFPRTTKINQPIRQSRREYLFNEPQFSRGYPRKNLAELAPATANARPTTIRETRPAPPTSGIRLHEPAPIDGENAAHRDDRSRPLALGGVEPGPPSLTEEVVGARYPTAPEPAALRPDPSGWRPAASPGFPPSLP